MASFNLLRQASERLMLMLWGASGVAMRGQSWGRHT
jgi:hypothetical protein